MMKVPVLFSVFVILFVSLRTGDVTEAIKCYSCTSSLPNCQKSFFLDLAISQESGCICCKKSTSSSGETKRECVSDIISSLIGCAVPTGDSHVCYSDLCNGSNDLRPIGLYITNGSTRLQQYNGNTATAILALLSLAAVVLIRY